MDIGYALVTLRIFDRYKTGSVIKSKDLTESERIALLSNIWPDVKEQGFDQDF